MLKMAQSVRDKYVRVKSIEIQWMKAFFRPKTLVYRRKTKNKGFLDSKLGNLGLGVTRLAQRKKIAALISEYPAKSHADVIVTKFLKGFPMDEGFMTPRVDVASLYIDQIPDHDIGRAMAADHGVTVYPSIVGALTLGGKELAVDGVLLIGEHGDYAWNEKQQQLFPRKYFMEQTCGVFSTSGRSVPVFNDKHLSYNWHDARWMVDRARALSVPFMAGSSLPLSWRNPWLEHEPDSPISEAMAIGFSGLDIYGFHALDVLQAFVERRRNGESGVAWVQCLQGDKMWQAVDAGHVRQDLLDAALAAVPTASNTSVRTVRSKNTALFLFRYNDGLPGAVFMLDGYARDFCVAVKIKRQSRPVAVRIEERPHPRHPHFAFLLHAIERMIHSGEPSYPVERTLLSGGILDRALTSRIEGQRKIETPELAIRYTPVDYPHAPRPMLPL